MVLGNFDNRITMEPGVIHTNQRNTFNTHELSQKKYRNVSYKDTFLDGIT